VAGISRVNRDFQFSEEWQAYGFIFSVPHDGTNDCVRLGEWEVKGRVYFDDLELLPVEVAEMSLGEAESTQGNVYRFTPQFGLAGANYHRPLWLNRASFNSDRWVFSPGAALVYRMGVSDTMQTNARVQVSINYHQSGKLQIEASKDASSWLVVGTLDGKTRSGSRDLPASLFPAAEVFLRLSTPGPEANLQVNRLDYEAGLTSSPRSGAGQTQFYETVQTTGELAVRPVGLTAGGAAGQRICMFLVTNQSQQPLRINATLVGLSLLRDAGTSRTLGPGQGGGFIPTTRFDRPGQYTLAYQFADENGRVLHAGRTEAQVGILEDSRAGYWVQGAVEAGVWWCESGWKVGWRMQPAKADASTGPTPVTVSAARGEYEAAQVVVHSDEARAELTLAQAKPFLARDGAAAPIRVGLHEVAYVNVTHPTDGSCARGWYPDPLPPLRTPLRLARARSQPLWLTFFIPRETKPGDYTGGLELKINEASIRIPLAVHVYDFELPRETHLRSAFGLGTGEINRYHKLKRPEDRQAVYEKYLQNFAEHRVSPYSFFDYSRMDVRFTGEGTNKRAQVDFTQFDQAAAKWLDEAKFNSFLLPLRGMGGGTFHSRHLGELEGFKEGTPEHARLFSDYLGQVERHLKARGWLDKAYTYWFDEPDPKDYEFVVDGMKRIRAAAPGLKRMLTEQPEKELLGHVEIWCGLTPEWTREKVAARRAAGEEVWWYLCTGPKAPYVTIFTDHPGTAMRLWPWQSWQYGVQGILVWASTYWTSGAAFPDKLQDPWSDPMSYVSGYDFKPGHVGYWGNGDGRFLYPPRRDPNTATEPNLAGPITSIRWENLRDGLEDYEYFWLLEQEVKRVAALPSGTPKPDLAEARRLLIVPDEISKDLTHFTTDPRPMLAHREKLARMIETLQRVR
jgi:hypothetical protein